MATTFSPNAVADIVERISPSIVRVDAGHRLMIEREITGNVFNGECSHGEAPVSCLVSEGWTRFFMQGACRKWDC